MQHRQVHVIKYFSIYSIIKDFSSHVNERNVCVKRVSGTD